MEKFARHTGTARAAATQQRRHRPDHPGRLAQAGQAHRLRGRAVRGVAQGPRLRPQPAEQYAGRLDPRRRPRLRHRAPRASTRCGRCMDYGFTRRALAPVRRHLPRQLRQGRAARGAGGPGRRRAAVEARRVRARDSQITVDLQARTVHGGATRRRPSTSTTTPAGGCSRASTTSASRCSTPTRSPKFEPARPGPADDDSLTSVLGPVTRPRRTDRGAGDRLATQVDSMAQVLAMAALVGLACTLEPDARVRSRTPRKGHAVNKIRPHRRDRRPPRQDEEGGK